MTETTQDQLHVFQISNAIKRICNQLHCAIYHKNYTGAYWNAIYNCIVECKRINNVILQVNKMYYSSRQIGFILCNNLVSPGMASRSTASVVTGKTPVQLTRNKDMTTQVAIGVS